MSRYINPYTDFGFKKLFGEEANKDLLIDFLNAVLPEKHRIKTLTFRNLEQLGITIADRRAVYDIYCTAENGEHFIVEMQKEEQHYFKDRAIFYSAFPICHQGKKGKKWNYELTAIYFVGILDFEYDEEEERRKLQRNVQLKDQDGDLFYDKLEFVFLQMPLFTKTESELETQKDKWCYFLKHLPDFDQIPAILREPVFEQAFATAELVRMDGDELLLYEASLKVYRDNYSAWETAEIKAEARGEARGKAEGIAEGKTEEKFEIARNMKKDGVDLNLIAKYTGLTPEEIKRLN